MGPKGIRPDLLASSQTLLDIRSTNSELTPVVAEEKLNAVSEIS
jgi:hypothetical protein